MNIRLLKQIRKRYQISYLIHRSLYGSDSTTLVCLDHYNKNVYYFDNIKDFITGRVFWNMLSREWYYNRIHKRRMLNNYYEAKSRWKK